MKKLISLGLIFVLGLSACGKGEETQVIESSGEDYTFNYATDDASMDYFYEADNYDIILVSSPFYVEEVELSMPAHQQFNQLKAEKVKEIEVVTEELFAAVEALNNEIERYTAVAIYFMGKVYAERPGKAEMIDAMLNSMVEYSVERDSFYALYNSVEGANYDDDFVDSFNSFQRSIAAINYAESSMALFMNTVLNTNQLLIAMEGRSEEGILEGISEVDKVMRDIEDMNERMEVVLDLVYQVDYGIRQIDTAGYYLALGSIEFIKENAASVRENVLAIEESEDVDAEELVMLGEYVDMMEAYADEFIVSMGEMDTSDLLLDMEEVVFSVMPVVHAGFTDFMKSSYGTMKSGLNYVGTRAYNAGAAVTQFGWDAGKGLVKHYQQGQGVVLDGVGAVTKSTMDFYTGLYYGNSLADIKERQNNNYKQVVKNFQEGKSGQQILNDTYAILEETDNVVGEAVESTAGAALDYLVEDTIAEGYPSWVLGGLARMASSTFTSLGKGASKLANSDSDAFDYAEGLFDVVTSLMGGSKSIVKGSKAVSGVSKTTKGFWDTATGFVKKVLSGNKIKKLEKVQKVAEKARKASGLAKTEKTLLRKSINRTKYEINRLKKYKTSMDDQLKKGKDVIKNLVPDAAEGVKETVKKEVPKQLHNVFKKKYKAGLQGLLNVVKTEIADSPADFFNWMVGGTVDNYLKNLMKDWLTVEDEIEVVEDEQQEEEVEEGEEEAEQRGEQVEKVEKTVTRDDEEEKSVAVKPENYDGVYSGTYTAHGFSSPITVMVSGDSLSGNFTMTLSQSGATATANSSATGTVDENGNISGSISGSGTTVAQGMSINTTSSGSFSGFISDGVMTVDYSTSSTSSIPNYGPYTVGDSGSMSLVKE